MSVRVKICGMTDVAAVHAAAAAGADAVGFVFFEKSPRNLSIDAACEIATAVPDGVLKVAVMLHPDAQLCAAVLQQMEPDVLQTDAADFDYLDVPQHVQRWPVLRENRMDAATELPERFVYEGRLSGHGQTVDWQQAAAIARRGDMILAGGLDVTNVAEAIATVNPWCVDVSSAVESAPGVKDAARISQFVAAAKAAT